MNLIQEYLDKVQKIDGIYVLTVPDDTTQEVMAKTHDDWISMYPEEHLIIMPQKFSISKINRYSFYIALMLIRGNKRVTRLQWMKEIEYSKSNSPYLALDKIDGKEVLIKRFPNHPEEDEFFIVCKDDLDAEDYIIVE